ncbi:MAG TPA: glycosyltransferase 61 family protein [Rickettsiales bacterium]|nr:glycosyltransferase 61 family protein [Rickettsiales bacterium]
MQKYQYNLPLPKNFNENDSSFDKFKNIKPVEFYNPEIIFEKNVRIATNSVAFRYFKIFKETCITNNYELYRKNYKFFLKFIFPHFNFSKKRFLLITDEWTSNYYHWHIFALTKLLILKNANLLENSKLFLPKKYKQYPFALASLKKLGVKAEQIVFLRRKSNIKVQELVFIKTQQDTKELSSLGDLIIKNTTQKPLGFGEKIYISRDGQKLRYVENEKEFVQLVEKYGFKKIIAEKFSYDEQIAIMKEAKYVISPHGAGLTNILFMKKNSSILEIAPEPHPEKQLSDYYKLASFLGINYFYHKSEPHSGQTDSHTATFLIDLEKAEKNIKLMLANG